MPTQPLIMAAPKNSGNILKVPFEVVPNEQTRRKAFVGKERAHRSILSEPTPTPASMWGMHKRVVLQYLIAPSEPFQSSVLKPDKAKSGLCASVFEGNSSPVCVARRKEHRFE
jgi:hypothetical protein